MPEVMRPPRSRKIWVATAAVASLIGAVIAVPTAAAGAPDEPTVPVFQDGLAQPVFTGPWITQELWVESEFDTDGDGKLDRMHVDVTRPRETQTDGLKVPVLYETSPYYAGTASTQAQYFWQSDVELGVTPPLRTSPPLIGAPGRTSPVISTSLISTWVPRGFAVVHSESPGTGLSQGCPTVGGPNESLAPKAVIDWLNGRAKGFTSADGDVEVSADWSTGKVGMTGTSYNGTLPLAAATTGVDGLEAIVPVAPNTGYYPYYRSNGLVRAPGGWVGEDIDYLFDYINSGALDTRQYCIETVRDVMQANQDRVTGDYNDFWEARDYIHQLDDVKAAVFMAHAFNDWNVVPEHSLRITDVLKEKGVETMQYYHQGGHGGNPPTDLLNRWWSHYLYGIDNGIDSDPNRAWITRNEGVPSTVTPYADYPNPAAEPVTLTLQGSGTGDGVGLTSRATGDSAVHRFTDAGSTTCTLANLATTPSQNRLMYVSPKLLTDMHISGTGSVTLRMTMDAPRANLSVALVKLPWTGASACNSGTTGSSTSVITRAWADPLNRNSLTREDPITPGEFVDVTIPLQPDDQIIRAGQQIGLVVFSTDREFTLRPQPGTEISIDLAGSSVELPVVDGRTVDSSALTLDATPRTLGGKVFVSVSATNDGGQPADITIETEYGNKTFTDVAPGKTVAVSVNTRLGSTPTGAATVTATRMIDGQPLIEVKTAPFGAFPTAE